MPTEHLSERYVGSPTVTQQHLSGFDSAALHKPIGNSRKQIWGGTPTAASTDPRIRGAAMRIVELGWVTDERIEDVVAWLAAHWHSELELTTELRVLMNEDLPAAEADDRSTDERDWVEPLIEHVERATGLTIPARLRMIIGVGVVHAMCVMWTDHGHGSVPARGIVYARDRRGDNGGLRAVLAGYPGVQEHEAHRVAKLLLGTAWQDRDAYPFRGERLGMSGALPSYVFRLPVTVQTALAWAHLVTRAGDPTITTASMRRLVTRPLQARYRELPGQLLQPLRDEHEPGLAMS